MNTYIYRKIHWKVLFEYLSTHRVCVGGGQELVNGHNDKWFLKQGSLP